MSKVDKSKKFLAWAKLFRIEHCLALGIATIIALKILSISDLNLLFLSFLVPFFVSCASFALNDFYDIETDKINKKYDRPLVTGLINPFHAYIASIIFFILGILISSFINLYAFLLTLFASLASYFYNIKLKDIALIGNIYIAFTMSLPFLFAVTIANNLNMAIILLSLCAFFLGLGREIIKTVQDFEGDLKARKSKTLPFYIGKDSSMKLATFFLLLALILSFFLLYEIFKNYEVKNKLLLTIPYIIAIAAISFCIPYAWKNMNHELIRKLTLYAIFFVLLSIFLGL